MIYKFADFELDPDERRLRNSGAEVALQPKTFETLVALVANAGHLLSKDELMDRVWPGQVVTENAVARAIKEVRKALRDDAEHPQFVQTVRGSGYRFLVDVQTTIAAQSSAVPADQKQRVFGIWTTILLSIVLVLTIGVVWFAQAPGPKSPGAPRTIDEPLSGARADARELYVEGRSHLQRRTTTEREIAHSKFSRALELEPNFAEAMVGLAMCELLGPAASVADGSRQRGLEWVNRALSLKPHLGEAHALLGLVAVDAPDGLTDARRQEAKRHLNRAIELSPNFADAYVWRATLQAGEGQLEAAINDLQVARALDPLHSTVAGNLAFSLHKLGNVDEAVELLEEHAKVPGARGAVAYNILAILRGAGRLDKALYWARKTVLDYPDYAYPAALLARAHQDLGLSAAAQLWAERALELKSADGPALDELLAWGFRTGDSALYERVMRSHTAADSDATRPWAIAKSRSAALAGNHARIAELLEPYFGKPEQVVGERGSFVWIADSVQSYAFSKIVIGEPERVLALMDKVRAETEWRVAAGYRGYSPLDLVAARNSLLLGKSDDAFANLRNGLANGWLDVAELRHDPRWAELREQPRYDRLVNQMQSRIKILRATALDQESIEAFETKYSKALTQHPEVAERLSRLHPLQLAHDDDLAD